jgi:enoyl-CoA hydratase/carnithine racemase
MKYLPGEPQDLPGNRAALAGYQARHFLFAVRDGVATLTLNRPERKNPLTFESYAELRDLFRALAYADDVQAIVIRLDMPGLLAFTRMTGDLVKAMRACPQPVIAAIDGICAGAGSMMALASDIRLGTERSKTAFLFTRVGLAGCDMGACALLPRVIGQGRAAELLYTGRSMSGAEGERWGFFNSLHAPDALLAAAQAFAQGLADGPTFAHGMTKKMLQQEWNMGVDEAIEAEAQAQAICMATNDFHRAYHAFVAKQKPVFEGD